MTIRDPAKFMQSLPDWAMLDGCFGNGITPSDIDGWVERNGQCLFLEHKLSSAAMTTGQNRGFRALAAQGNKVIVFWGDSDDGRDMTHMMIHEIGREAVKAPATLDDLRAEAIRWYQAANAPPPAVAGTYRHTERLEQIKLDRRPCISCGETPTRVWPVPEDQQKRFGQAVSYCQMCEPFAGEPLTQWAGE